RFETCLALDAHQGAEQVHCNDGHTVDQVTGEPVVPVAERRDHAIRRLAHRYFDTRAQTETRAEWRQRILCHPPAPWSKHCARSWSPRRDFHGNRAADEAVVQRQNTVTTGLGPPLLDES